MVAVDAAGVDGRTGIAVGLLGPVGLAVDGRPVELTGLRRRAVLAVLAAANTAVPLDRLADAAWSDTGSPPARNTVQVHVHQLRQLLAPHSELLRHTSAGYRLGDVEVDVRVVEDGLSRARAADRGGDLIGATAAYRDALGRWRGEFCADLTELPYFRAARTFYESLRLDALEAGIAAGLQLGTPGLAVQLGDLVQRHPLRERFWGLLMTALYREGRQGDALAVYRQARAALAEEAGIDPGTALRQLERAILAQAGTTALLRVVVPAGGVATGPVISWLDATGAHRTRALPSSGRLLIGREPAAEVSLNWDGTVSRSHATIEVTAGRATLLDLGSRNGTFLNGERVQAGEPGRPLRPGDLLRCGDTVLGVGGAAPGLRSVPVSEDTRPAEFS
jgi:SARP family transcriptional regulator, regulator of embCAB operon